MKKALARKTKKIDLNGKLRHTNKDYLIDEVNIILKNKTFIKIDKKELKKLKTNTLLSILNRIINYNK